MSILKKLMATGGVPPVASFKTPTWCELVSQAVAVIDPDGTIHGDAAAVARINRSISHEDLVRSMQAIKDHDEFLARSKRKGKKK